MKGDMNGAEILIKSLEDLEVKQVFGYTGAAILPVFHALGKSSIGLTVNSNEQACAFSAAGYSRSSDKVGVAIVTSGPAITNTLTAVADSYGDSIPLLVFAGQVPEHKIGTDAFQHINVRGIFEDAAKKVILLSNGADIESIVKDAYYFAKSGKPGPVVIDLPLNIQQRKGQYRALDHEMFSSTYGHENHPSKKQCRSFFKLLQKSRKPILYLGGGLNSDGASRAIREFNELFNIPFVNTLMAKGLMDEGHPRSLGTLGMFGTPYANMAIQETDFFFAIGVRWDDRVAEKVGGFALNADIAYIDINPEKVHQIRSERHPKFSFIGDAKTALEDLTEYAKQENIEIDIREWQEKTSELRQKWPLDYNRSSKSIQQAEVLDLLSTCISDETRITTGVGNHQMLAAQYLRRSKPKSFMTSGSFGTMGFALPAAIGVHYANPDAEVIAIDGDGGLKMNMGELHTIGSLGLPIKILVLNNHGDGMVRNVQTALYGGEFTGTVRDSDISLAEVARVCGFGHAKRVSDRKELRESIDDFLASRGPSLLEVITDFDEAVYPKVPPGKPYREMILGPYIRERR